MEILIKGMDMPETCIDCPLHNGEYGQCNINHNIYISFDDRPRKCPLIEINSHYLIDANLPSAQPEKRYLRLIDVDNLIDDCKRYLATLNPDRDGKECTRIHWLIGVLNNAPSVNPDTSTDCISRQAAIDAIVQYLGRINRDFDNWKGTARIILDHVPSAQPEIIHCRDCKHRGEKPIADGRYWCEIHDTFMYYCSDAERRIDE